VQAHSKSGRWPSGLVTGLKKIVAEEGVSGLRVGWVPTLFGYGAQGLFKFGLNEFFKDLYGGWIGEENLKSKATKMAMWAAASGSAEIFADVALCPFEMTKVRMQVTLPGDAGSVPKSLIPAFSALYANRKDTKFPFGSLYPLWGRQGTFPCAAHVAPQRLCMGISASMRPACAL
jgi:solute carrier family 25 phosphate transporter 3